MTFEKPKIKRVYVQIRDPDGVEKDESFTVYHTTPLKFRQKIDSEIAAPLEEADAAPASSPAGG